MYYTYAYLREDGTPYYIGKGCRNRLHHPRSRAVGMPPKERRVYLKTNLSEIEAYRHEMEMIQFYGRLDLGTGILRNKSDGGDGNMGRIYSQEARDKISQYHKGRKQSEEHIRKRTETQVTKRKWIKVTEPDGVCYNYHGMTEFSKKMGWPTHNNGIRRVLTGKWKHYKGYKFEYVADMGIRTGS